MLGKVVNYRVNTQIHLRVCSPLDRGGEGSEISLNRLNQKFKEKSNISYYWTLGFSSGLRVLCFNF